MIQIKYFLDYQNKHCRDKYTDEELKDLRQAHKRKRNEKDRANYNAKKRAEKHKRTYDAKCQNECSIDSSVEYL